MLKLKPNQRTAIKKSPESSLILAAKGLALPVGTYDVLTLEWPLFPEKGHIRTEIKFDAAIPSHFLNCAVYLYQPHWDLVRAEPEKQIRYVSDDLVSMIATFEGFSGVAYRCPAGVPTIGYGHTGNVRMGDTITKAAARQLLIDEINEIARQVHELASDLHQREFNALVSLAFNIGVGALSRSTLIKKIYEGRFLDAGLEFLRWNKIGDHPSAGLTNRREVEAKLFLGV